MGYVTEYIPELPVALVEAATGMSATILAKWERRAGRNVDPLNQAIRVRDVL
jgi:hypothetical protein